MDNSIPEYLWTRIYSDVGLKGVFGSITHLPIETVCSKINETQIDMVVVGHCTTTSNSTMIKEIFSKDATYESCDRHTGPLNKGCVAVGCFDQLGPHITFVDTAMSVSLFTKAGATYTPKEIGDRTIEFLLLERDAKNPNKLPGNRHYNKISRKEAGGMTIPVGAITAPILGDIVMVDGYKLMYIRDSRIMEKYTENRDRTQGFNITNTLNRNLSNIWSKSQISDINNKYTKTHTSTESTLTDDEYYLYNQILPLLNKGTNIALLKRNINKIPFNKPFATPMERPLVRIWTPISTTTTTTTTTGGRRLRLKRVAE
jgi:hypothetical protein